MNMFEQLVRTGHALIWVVELGHKKINATTLEVDNDAVREAQIARLKSIKTSRDSVKVSDSLAALTAAAKSGTGNLLELALSLIHI